MGDCKRSSIDSNAALSHAKALPECQRRRWLEHVEGGKHQRLMGRAQPPPDSPRRPRSHLSIVQASTFLIMLTL
jgi:hypothetical protein